MSSNRAKNTKPEIILRRTLIKIGIIGARYNLKGLTGRPDIVFPMRRLAIFVNGCFWHRCPYCKDSLPKVHREFWINKFRANKGRDKRKSMMLRRDGWSVMTLWECQIKKNNLRVARRIDMALSNN